MSEKVHCWRCTMSFTVCEPHPLNELGRCPECFKPWFWNMKRGMPTLAGVRPAYAHMFERVARLLNPAGR